MLRKTRNKTRIDVTGNSEVEYISGVLELNLHPQVIGDELQFQEAGEELMLSILLAKECYRLSEMVAELQLDLHAFAMRASKSDPNE